MVEAMEKAHRSDVEQLCLHYEGKRLPLVSPFNGIAVVWYYTVNMNFINLYL